METTTSFDLNHAIQSWREHVGESPALHNENLDELESHLRDSVARLQTAGLSVQEAFLIASQRVGNSNSLSQEFSKVNSGRIWRDRTFWMLAGMLFMIAGWELSLAAASILIYVGKMLTGANGIALGWFAVVAQILMLALVVMLFRLLAAGKWSGHDARAVQLKKRPYAFAAILFVGILLLRVASTAFDLLVIHGLPVQTLGQVYMIRGWFSAVGPIFVVTILVLFARLLSDRKINSRVAALAFILLLAMEFSSLSAKAEVAPGRGIVAVVDNKATATLDDAMKLWTAGQKDAAMAKFLTADFSKRPLFPSGSVLNYTEAQFIALPDAAREKLSKQMMDDIRVIKEIAAQVKNAGKIAAASGNKTKADESNAKLQQCGDAFDRPDSLAILKLVGKALKKIAADDSGKNK